MKDDNGFKWMKKIYEEGKLSALKGLLLNENPYEPGTMMSVSWEAGWQSVEAEQHDEGC